MLYSVCGHPGLRRDAERDGRNAGSDESGADLGSGEPVFKLYTDLRKVWRAGARRQRRCHRYRGGKGRGNAHRRCVDTPPPGAEFVCGRSLPRNAHTEGTRCENDPQGHAALIERGAVVGRHCDAHAVLFGARPGCRGSDEYIQYVKQYVQCRIFVDRKQRGDHRRPASGGGEDERSEIQCL